MSRILMGSMQYTGHVAPGLPIARKLIERGHEVTWYSGRKFQAKIEATGARFMPMNAQADYDDADLDAAFPQRAALKGIAQLKFDIKHVFADAARHHVADLSGFITRMKPDVLLVDSGFTGAQPLRHRFGLPLVYYGMLPLMLTSADTAPFGFGILPGSGPFSRVRNRALNWLVDNVLFGDVNRYIHRELNALGVPADRHVGLMEIPRGSDLYLQLTDETFEYPRADQPEQLKFVGPMLPDLTTDFPRPDWWDEMLESRKPVIHVTQGTLATDSSELIVPALQALADEDVLVIVSTGGKPVDSVRLDPLPANARIARFIPYGPFLPHVDVMITNGGYGGVHLALANGVPMVVAGASEDKPEVANRVAWAGVGVNLRTGRPKPAQIKAGVRSVLNDPAYRERARQLQARFARHDAPTAVAEHIERLIAERQPKTAAQPAPLHLHV